MAITYESTSRGQSVVIVTLTTIVLTTIFVFARLVSRLGILRTRTADDWFIILAWALALGLSISVIYGNSEELGQHEAHEPTEWLPLLRRSEYAFTILYNPALMATKTSILILYLRMAKNTQKLLRVASYVTLALVNISGVILTFLNAFQCDPPNAAFNFVRTAESCNSIVTLYLCSAPVNIFTDLTILVLPLPVLTSMRLPPRQKSVLVATFALGIFVTIVDVVRIYYLQETRHSQNLQTSRLGTVVDFAWNAGTAFMWSAVEVNVGIICACIPTLKPLIKMVLPAMILGAGEISSSEKTSSIPSPTQHLDDACPSFFSADDSTVDRPPPVFTTEPPRNGDDQFNFMIFQSTSLSMDLGPGTVNLSQSNQICDSEPTTHYGFVNMNHPKTMLNIHGWESFKYCCLVTMLFFLWGFSYGLLNLLNNAISSVTQPHISHTLSLSTAYFGAYFLGALTVGQFVLRFVGFKATFITGLTIYGTGTLIFWPSAVLNSYPGFVLSNFVVGFGLAVLETAANPFIIHCGPRSMSEFRLLIAQGVQATATILSQLLAEKVLFDDITSLIDLQWTYLAVTLFTVILALFFYYLAIPEISDDELALQAGSDAILITPENFAHSGRTWWHRFMATLTSFCARFMPKTLLLCIIAQFLYVSAQESLSIFFVPLLTSLPKLSTPLALSFTNYNLLGHSLFALGRFTFAPLCLFIAPRLLLLTAFLLSLFFATCSALLPITEISDKGSLNYRPTTAIPTTALLLFFSEAPIFPLLFTMGLLPQGRNSKRGAALLTAAISGGGAFPWVMLAVESLHGGTEQSRFWVLVALFTTGTGIIAPIVGMKGFMRKEEEQSNNLSERSDNHEMRNNMLTSGIDLISIRNKKSSYVDRFSSIKRLAMQNHNAINFSQTPKNGSSSGDLTNNIIDLHATSSSHHDPSLFSTTSSTPSSSTYVHLPAHHHNFLHESA
ncbi:BgTH12-02852 [Blumeria graminis f. sp. triticale]|uniref:BgTH12-02852 n=1 Tax=Blumeria graminis f. sp. triticale TaxID=1689686 RepID=A0A9W4GF39_BLUGR|nr:BgTH12-02852 [Blumeria graminis f. sp. triticale]